MAVKITGKLMLAVSVSLLSACGMFGKDKIDLDGERIAVLANRTHLPPDYAYGEVTIKLPAPYINKEWSQNGGNAAHLLGHVAARDNLESKWDTSFGTGNSKRDFLIASPIIAHKAVFAMDADAKVSAYRMDDGKQIWQRKLRPVNEDDAESALKGAGIAYANKKIYAATGFGGVFSMDMTNGKVVWWKDLGVPMRSAPTVQDGMLFVQTIDNRLIALSADNGGELWDYKSPSESTTMVGAASPAYSVEQDVVVAAFSNGEIQAFKASTGTPLWMEVLQPRGRTNSLANINAIKASPVIDEDKVYAVGYNSTLAAIDLRSGTKLWEREIASSGQPWVAGQYLFAFTNDFDLLALEKDTGKIVWNTNIPTGEEADTRGGVSGVGPVLVSNRLLVAISNGYIFSVSPYSGKILSYVSLPDGVELTPVVGDEMVIFTTNEAEMLTFK